MPKASALFQVPSDTAALADALWDAGAEGVHLPELDSPEDLASHLAGLAGTMLDVDFEDDDPLSPAIDLAAVLDQASVPYWIGVDAFEERSRGIRVKGRVLLNVDGGTDKKVDLQVAWEDGPPRLDEASLRAAGMSEADADAAVEALLGPSERAPAP